MILSRFLHSSSVFCLLFAAMALSITPLHAREVVLSEKPIAIRIPVGKELIIKFPQPATHTRIVNEPAANTVSTLLTPQGVLYLTPTQAFDKSRMIAELVDGRMVMLDIEASEMGPFDSDMTIVDRPQATTQIMPSAPPQGDVVATTQAEQRNPYKPDFLSDGEAKTLNIAAGDLGGAQQPDVGTQYHQMVRYGFRHYVGPARLIGEDLGKPVKVGKSDVAKQLLRMNDGRLSLKPLRQWQIGDSYLTVLLVNNLSSTAVEFDPRAIRGRWMFAAALYPVLEPRGSRFDQTLWALISNVPFDKAAK